MLKIRLKKCGKKTQVSYKIVAVDSRVKREGKCIEELGFYNRRKNELFLKKKRVKEFFENGAKPTKAVDSLINKANASLF
jgi:small subunit ribosomal protein S16